MKKSRTRTIGNVTSTRTTDGTTVERNTFKKSGGTTRSKVSSTKDYGDGKRHTVVNKAKRGITPGGREYSTSKNYTRGSGTLPVKNTSIKSPIGKKVTHVMKSTIGAGSSKVSDKSAYRGSNKGYIDVRKGPTKPVKYTKLTGPVGRGPNKPAGQKPKKKMGALPKLKALGGKLMGAMSKAVKRG